MYGGLGYDDEVPNGFRDADLEMAEYEAEAAAQRAEVEAELEAVAAAANRKADEAAEDGPCLVCGQYDGDHDPGCMAVEQERTTLRELILRRAPADQPPCPECGAPTYIGIRGRICTNGGCENS